MALTVFDTDVLIAYLNAADVHHHRAIELMRSSRRRMVCSVNYTEALIGPLRRSVEHARRVTDALGALGFEIVVADVALAERAAAVRVRTNLKIPDAFALATAIHAERRGHSDVTLASFDEKVRAAHDLLRPFTPLDPLESAGPDSSR
jgi:predicted nucleic acid-binding protein